MKKRKNKKSIFKYKVLQYVTVAAWCLLITGGGIHAALSFFKNMETEIKKNDFTSMDFRYEEKFQDTLDHYPYFETLYQEEYAAPVPGLESTDILGETCSRMVPQGICIAGDYMLVTAYDTGEFFRDSENQNRLEYRVNRSVLYVLSNQNPQKRELLTTIVLPDVNHVGGVAFDGENVWIAKSTSRQCSVISYDVVRQAAEEKKSSYELEKYDQNVPCGVIASFVTWHKGKLWVGTYANRTTGTGSLRGFQVVCERTENEKVFTLEKTEDLQIPEFANGAAFMELGDQTYLLVSTSKGRHLDSELYFYKIYQDLDTGKNLYDCYGSRKFPPMAEEVVWDGDQTYLLFESSATCYSARKFQKCSYPVDRICGFSTAKLLWQDQEIMVQQIVSIGKQICLQMMLDCAYQERKYWKRYVVFR
ncbi:MAG: hypothetical protein HFH41_00080 [Lachnospiraceae bacterium]|nr:hypothetical protein [Lachnospiraceae bacterium]